MNILHTETLKGWGGQQNKVFKEMQNMKDLAHNVILFCNKNSEISLKAKEAGFKVYESHINKMKYLHSIVYVKKIIKEHNIDIVISHGSTDSWVIALAYIFSKRNFRIIRERHNLYEIKGFFSKMLHKKIFHKIISISDAVTNYLVSIGISKDKIFELPSVVNVEKFEHVVSTFRNDNNISCSAKVVGIFTSLRKDKGLFDFFEMSKIILKQYNDVYVVYGGKCSQQSKNTIMNFYKDNNYDISRVIWTGYTTDAPYILKSFDIYVFPTYSEGLGTVILEAMACKLPGIVYNKAPMNDLIKDGVNGCTATYRDTMSLTKCVHELLDNPNLLKLYGEKSFEIVKNKFDEIHMKDNIKSFLKSIE